MHKIIVFIIAIFLTLPISAKQGEEKQGYGAGGVRDDHASEMGVEKGKAWAGSKEKKVKEESKDEIDEEKVPKKDKKEKKGK